MFLTNTLLKRVKSKHILVLVESVTSGHQFRWLKERTADKIEIIRHDPFINRETVYREIKRLKSPKSSGV